MEKIGLVLEGGAAKGAYHIGAYEALEELGIEIDGIAGTSIGSINGAFLVADKLNLARSFWRNVDYRFFYGIDDKLQDMILNCPDCLETRLEITKVTFETIINGGVEVDRFLETLRKLLPEEDFRNSDKDFALVTVNLTKRREEVYYKEDIPKGKLVEYLLASSYIPGLKQKKIDGSIYLDGGFYDNLPFRPLERLGYKNLILVHCDGVGRIWEPDKDLNIIEINPSDDTGPLWNFHHDNTESLLKLGYLDTLKVFNKLIGDIYFISKRNFFKQISSLIVHGAKRNNLFLDNYQKILYDELYSMELEKNQKSLSLMILECIELVAKAYNIDRLKIYTVNEIIKNILLKDKSQLWVKYLNKEEKRKFKSLKKQRYLSEIFNI